MEKINFKHIGEWREVGAKGFPIAGGNNTNECISELADKVNELVEKMNKLETFTGNNLNKE